MALRLEQFHNSIFGTDITAFKSKEIALRNLDNIKVQDFLNMYHKFINANTLAIEHVYENKTVSKDPERKETIYNLTEIDGISLKLAKYTNGFTFSTILRRQNDAGSIFLNICNVGNKPVITNGGKSEHLAGFLIEDGAYTFVFDEQDDCFRIISGEGGSNGGTSESSVTIQTDSPHGFTDFTIVTFNPKTKIWTVPDLINQISADGIIKVINETTFKVVTNGIIEIPDGVLDDEDKPFVDGEFYFVSKEEGKEGKAHRNRYLGMEQTAFKVINIMNKQYALLMFDAEVNYNLYDESIYNLVGGEGIANIERLEKVEETAFTNTKEILKMKDELNTVKIKLEELDEKVYKEIVNAIYFEVKNDNPAITFTPVGYRRTNDTEEVGEWIPSDLSAGISADAIAIRINLDTIRIYNTGIIEIPLINGEEVKDDGVRYDEFGNKLPILKPEPLSDGHYYFVSQESPGRFHKYRYPLGCEQLAIKVVTENNIKKAIVLISDEVNFREEIEDDSNSTAVITKKEYESLKNSVMFVPDNFELESNKDYTFAAVYNENRHWVLADISHEKTADAISIKGDDGTIFVCNSGIHSIPEGALDDNGEEFVGGEYYFVSQKTHGGFSRARYEDGIEQTAFKVVEDLDRFGNVSKKAVILISDEINYLGGKSLANRKKALNLKSVKQDNSFATRQELEEAYDKINEMIDTINRLESKLK